MATLIRTGVLRNYFKVAQQLGLEPQPLLRKLRLSREMLADPDHWISGSGAVTLLEESARITQCPTFGLRMADLWQLSDLGVVSVLLTHQRTLRDAVGTLIQFRHLMNEFLVIRIEEVGKKVFVREDVVADDAGPSIQSVELALGTLSRMCSTLLGTSWHPLSVNFTHDAPPDLRLHRRIFGGSWSSQARSTVWFAELPTWRFPTPLPTPSWHAMPNACLKGCRGLTSRQLCSRCARRSI